MAAIILAIVIFMSVSNTDFNFDYTAKTPLGTISYATPKKVKKGGKSGGTAMASNAPKAGEKVVNRRYRKNGKPNGKVNGGKQQNNFVAKASQPMFERNVQIYSQKAGDVVLVSENMRPGNGFEILMAVEPQRYVALPLMYGGQFKEIAIVKASSAVADILRDVERGTTVEIHGYAVFARSLDLDMSAVKVDLRRVVRYITDVRRVVLKAQDDSRTDARFDESGERTSYDHTSGVVVDSRRKFYCVRCQEQVFGKLQEGYLMANGRPAYRAQCQVCAGKLNLIVSAQPKVVPITEFLEPRVA